MKNSHSDSPAIVRFITHVGENKEVGKIDKGVHHLLNHLVGPAQDFTRSAFMNLEQAIIAIFEKGLRDVIGVTMDSLPAADRREMEDNWGKIVSFDGVKKSPIKEMSKLDLANVPKPELANLACGLVKTGARAQAPKPEIFEVVRRLVSPTQALALCIIWHEPFITGRFPQNG